jgi:leucyl aminopeptidase (aminopeptidase T)
MVRPVEAILRDCLAVKAGERVLVVTDPAKRAIAEALVTGARAMGAETVLAEMSERETNGSEPPDAVAAAMLSCDVLIAPTTKSLSHTEARRAACEKGARAATLPGITEDMMQRTMGGDHRELRRTSRILADLLSAAGTVHITSPAGTDVTLDVAGRDAFADDGDLTHPGAFGNLPPGEGFIAPVEGRTNGKIVFDGSMWPMGILSEPIVATIEDGYAISFEGPQAREFESLISGHGRDAYAVGELGIGTNGRAILTGNVLEDEKIVGTIHIAFGDNHSFGGKVRVGSHQDGIVLSPTVDIDSDRVLENGKLLV